jgi:hypothetical protein
VCSRIRPEHPGNGIDYPCEEDQGDPNRSENMQNKIIAVATGLALALGTVAASSPASARGPGGHGGGKHWAGGGHWGGGHWRGGGWGGRNYYRGGAYLGGLAAGAIIGGALAAPYGYYSPYAYEPDYDYGPGVYAQPDQDDAYCAQRFRSYDPASGTYLGYDGRRHPCP